MCARNHNINRTPSSSRTLQGSHIPGLRGRQRRNPRSCTANVEDALKQGKWEEAKQRVDEKQRVARKRRAASYDIFDDWPPPGLSSQLGLPGVRLFDCVSDFSPADVEPEKMATSTSIAPASTAPTPAPTPAPAPLPVPTLNPEATQNMGNQSASRARAPRKRHRFKPQINSVVWLATELQEMPFPLLLLAIEVREPGGEATGSTHPERWAQVTPFPRREGKSGWVMVSDLVPAHVRWADVWDEHHSDAVVCAAMREALYATRAICTGDIPPTLLQMWHTLIHRPEPLPIGWAKDPPPRLAL